MELYPFAWMEAIISADSQASPSKVRNRKMEENRQIQMSPRQINRPDLHANSKISWTAVSR